MKLGLQLILLLLTAATSRAQLSVTVWPVKVAASKAVVPLAMKNNFTETIESARAVCFLLNEQGKVIGQSTKWVIGGTKDVPGLAAGATNAFYFVIASGKPFTMTNLTAKVSFTRVVLEGGKLPDLNASVQMRHAGKSVEPAR